MYRKVQALAEQILFAITIFILFVLVFEPRLVVPVWLQPIGRMHPVLLHFPIVMLMLAMSMEVFRFKPIYATNEFYRDFLSNLLLIGVLSAGVTVIMGLFLSHEDGYSGPTLNWHKWTGVGLFFIAALVYWARRKTWYTASLAKLGSVLTIVLLIGAGHYGAAVTHGADFLTEPLNRQRPTEPIALEQAVVFTDVIQPILEQKCVSCHNPDKLKGELSLANAEAIRRGGKGGKLFVAGKPEISLLLQRIHLPEEEKKHMPPLGKTQLTPNEIALLSLWVKDQADFKRKVVELPGSDSLRRLVTAVLAPSARTEASFDFAAADQETVTRLNNDYRTIVPLASESPALAVNLYNKSSYSSARLGELTDIRQQVVYLNLAKLPVTDSDLKTIGQFENLRKLDLNFTDVTGKGLVELARLPHLETLALAGTKLTYADLSGQLKACKHLKTVSIWNTGLSVADMHRLQKANQTIQFITGFNDDGRNPIKLNPPQIKNSSTIFDQSLALQLSHPIKGVQIRYTTDGTEPDSVHSPVFTNKTRLTEPTTIQAKAYKAGWLGSGLATFAFYKSAHKPDSVDLLLPLNPVHKADGAHTFFDGKLGTFNANSPAWANNWAGFKANEMALVAEFKQPITTSSVSLRTMVEPETGIFPPAVLEIWGGASRNQLKLIATIKPEQPAKKSLHVLKAFTCTYTPQTVSCLKIIAKPALSSPDERTHKREQGLLLVDEVFVN